MVYVVVYGVVYGVRVLYMFYVLGISSCILLAYYANRVKMQLWLHVPYYSTKSPYILVYCTIYYCIYVVFAYLATQMSVCMVNPVCSILIFLASRWVVILVLFQARVKQAVMQRCATPDSLNG